MNRTASCIKLIQILSARNDYVSTDELANVLEINKRNIKEYIKELEIAGYVIESKKGLYGGYKLDKSSILPSVKLTNDDKAVLQESVQFLQNSQDFMKNNEYTEIIGKIMSSVERKENITPLTMIDRFPLSMDKSALQSRYQDLSEAIESQFKCEINYTSSQNKTRLHIIHPYKLYVYNGAWFVLAFNETINDFGYFKLNRIESIYKTKNRFTIMRTFNESNYLDDFGMKQNGEYYHLELELEGLNIAMQERIYGKNQAIEVIDDKHIKFSCDMQNKEMIKSFVLSFGFKCKVISPQWLIDEIKNEYWKALDLYE
ncbi:MAG: WYL domain-containing protein [Acholeplasmatales bacterium]|nr:WYL domain-containing protein [Acholeplasmatales bacterium]